VIVWRAIGWALLIAGACVLARDAVAWFETRTWMPLAIGQLWYMLDRSSLNLVQAVIQRYLSPTLWDRVLVPLLLCWVFAALMGVGAVILVLARKRRLKTV
jgi:hypothetical protein